MHSYWSLSVWLSHFFSFSHFLFRNMVRNVKLGHGLFDLIKTEQAARVSAKYLKILFCESPSKLIIYIFRITLISFLNFFFVNDVTATVREWNKQEESWADEEWMAASQTGFLLRGGVWWGDRGGCGVIQVRMEEEVLRQQRMKCLITCVCLCAWKDWKRIQNIENLMPFHFILIFQNYTCVIITIWK